VTTPGLTEVGSLVKTTCDTTITKQAKDNGSVSRIQVSRLVLMLIHLIESTVLIDDSMAGWNLSLSLSEQYQMVGFHGLHVRAELLLSARTLRSFETKRNQFLYSYIRGGDSVKGRTTDTERAAGGKSQGRGNAKGGNGELHDVKVGFGFRSGERKWVDGATTTTKTTMPVEEEARKHSCGQDATTCLTSSLL